MSKLFDVTTDYLLGIEKKEEELSFKVSGVFKKGANGVGTIVDYFNTKKVSSQFI